MFEEKEVRPYSVLSAGYDAVMAYVNYGMWAAYVHRRLQRHHPEATTVLELGCGTGSLALELQPLGPYQYTATDRSPEMIRVAQRKVERAGASITVGVADFTAFEVEVPFDAVVLVYDGLNYALDLDRVGALLRCMYDALQPGGIVIFDQSTPANSINNEASFEDAGRAEQFAYKRRSTYDEEARLHTTAFTLTVDDQHFHEHHVQRAYTLDEIRSLIQTTSFVEEAAYQDFTTNPATEASERIHWVLRRPE